MNILYTTNEAFTGKVATGICSVFENNKDMEQLVVYIIGQGLSEESVCKYRKIEKKYKRKIEIIQIEDMMTYVDFDFDTSGWNPIILARLILDRLLPETVEKILYLDGDTVNIRSLKLLWENDLKGCVLGACIEATVDKGRRRALGMKNIPYINSGVLLINLKKWREEQIGQKILHYYKENNGKLVANDQDAINGALKGQIYYLKPQYNFYNIYWFYPYRILKKLMGDTSYYSKKTVEMAKMNPVIIHYLGEERPWRRGNRHKYRAYYYKYLKKTPWRREAMEKGWELYFVLWGIFNFFMRPFPMLRYQIINRLIPLFMKWREKRVRKEMNKG